MALDKQMEMFDEGGLEDDGGTIDPVSGNDVPPGSSKAEVRDDIPAQLSEGEFVFPADVVRYIGLEKLMMMRQQAKTGLKMMDEMGQMGNSDEATISDDLPFGMMDLIIVDNEDEEEYNDKKEMQEGGVVTPQDAGIFYQPSQFAEEGNRPGVATAAPDAASRQFVQQSQQAATPTVRYEQPQTTFGDFLKPPQGGPQTITIVNKETGEKELITFIPGVTKIKQGFVREEDYVPKEIVPETETTRVETTRVSSEEQTGGEDRDSYGPTDEEIYGPGGGRIGLGGFSDGTGLKKDATLVGVSFNNAGTLPGVAGSIQGALGLISGEGIPEGATATFTLDGETVTVNAPTYNSLKNNGFKGERANSILEELKESKRLTSRSKSMTEDFMSKSKEERRKETAAAVAANEKRVRAITEKQQEIAETKQKIKDVQAAARQELANQYESSADSGVQETQQAADDYTANAVAEAVSTGDYSRGFNEGGLASKPKPKAKKKMKRGGLASKK